jgi:hypothetical protein
VDWSDLWVVVGRSPWNHPPFDESRPLGFSATYVFFFFFKQTTKLSRFCMGFARRMDPRYGIMEEDDHQDDQGEITIRKWTRIGKKFGFFIRRLPFPICVQEFLFPPILKHFGFFSASFGMDFGFNGS